MPEPLTQHEVQAGIDPSVAKQYDTTTSREEQIDDLYKIIDSIRACLLTTQRPDVGFVSRSMVVARRSGPDFLFLANRDSRKFNDLRNSSTCQITFQNSSSQDWVSVSGIATVTSNTDSRIHELHNKGTAAWFGDLGDGKHDGSADDPRMTLIEVQATYIVYWKATVGTLGFIKEVGQAALTGQVANTGVTRELKQPDIAFMRKKETG